MFIIKEGLEKDIQAGDFVEILGQELPYDPTDGYEYEVLDTDEAAQAVLVLLPDAEAWASAELIDHVWREV